MRSSICQCLAGDTSEDAAIAPEAATAGSPIPGKVQSPTHRSPSMGVFCHGNCPSPALIPVKITTNSVFRQLPILDIQAASTLKKAVIEICQEMIQHR